jgi:hypothetical protein
MNKRTAQQLYGIRRTPIGARIGRGFRDFDVWANEMRVVDRERSASLWQLGDLLLFGEDNFGAYGQKYETAIAATGLSYSRLATLKSVCRRFPFESSEFCRRRQNLSFGHHAEIVSLPDDKAGPISRSHGKRRVDTSRPTGGGREASRKAGRRRR